MQTSTLDHYPQYPDQCTHEPSNTITIDDLVRKEMIDAWGVMHSTPQVTPPTAIVSTMAWEVQIRRDDNEFFNEHIY